MLNICSSEGINCEYFGFYGLEEHVDKHWFECQGWDTARSSLYKAAGWGSCRFPCETTEWKVTGSRCSNGWERKIPDSGDCAERACPSMDDDLDQLFSVVNSGMDGRTSASALRTLTSTVNMTDYSLWQIVAVISMNCDTGSHNYYLHGPTLGTESRAGETRLWRVISEYSNGVPQPSHHAV